MLLIVFHQQRQPSLGSFVVELKETQDVQHGLSDVGPKTMWVLKKQKKKEMQEDSSKLFHLKWPLKKQKMEN